MQNRVINPYFSFPTLSEQEDIYDQGKEDGLEWGVDYGVHDKWQVIEDIAYHYAYENVIEYDDEKIQKDGRYYMKTTEMCWYTERFINLQHSYIEQGLIAWELKYKKAYLVKYTTFNEYCQAELNLSSWQVNRLINASRIGLLLITNTFEHIPTCESQARVLTRYYDNEIIYYWREISEKYKGREHEIAAQRIWCEIREIQIREGLPVKESKHVNIKIKRKLYEKLVREAMSYHLSLIEYLEYYVAECDFNISNEPTRESMAEELEIIEELEKQWELEKKYANSS